MISESAITKDDFQDSKMIQIGFQDFRDYVCWFVAQLQGMCGYFLNIMNIM